MNLKLAFRRLVKTPLVSAVAILSLALGIGANAAIYSLFDQTLLRALPVERPRELVNLWSPGPRQGSNSCGQAGDCEHVFSYPMFRDLERAQTVFTGLAGHVSFGANLAFQSQTVSGEGMLVSGSYFPVLGLRPAIGRLLDANDDRNIGGHFVTVLSHRYWTMRLGGDPNVLNSTIMINGQAMTIVGVAPGGFASTTLGLEPEVFVPMTMRAQMVPGWKGFENRRSYWMYVFARLKPGTTIEQARAAMNGVYRPIINDVEAPLQKGMSDQTMARFRARALMIDEGRRGQSQVHEEARTPLILLFAITGIVLLIACANIANLLLARGAGRATEMAVRLSHWRRPPSLAGAAAHRVVRARGAGRAGRSSRCPVDAGLDRLARAAGRLIVASVRAAAGDGDLRRGAVRGHRFPVRVVPGAAQHASGSGLDDQVAGGPAVGSAGGVAIPHDAGDRPDRAVDGAAHRRRSLHQEPDERQPRRSRRERGQRRDLRRVAAPEWLRRRALARVLRAPGGRDGGGPRRHRCRRLDGAAPERQQLGQRRQRAGLRQRTRYRHALQLQPDQRLATSARSAFP